MFGFRKSPAPSPPPPAATASNPKKAVDTTTTNRRANSEPTLPFPDDDDDDYFGRGPTSLTAYKQKKELESMSVQELETYAVDRAQDTTKSVNNCLKIAGDIREDAAKTLETLHNQGEQIHRTHVMAADMDRDLSKGEKLLNNLGGMFSMPWAPKKTKKITGPKTSKDDSDMGKRSTPEQREKLGLDPKNKGRGSRALPSEPGNAMQSIENERVKQEDALDDLGDILGELKGMAVGMGTELNKQNKALDDLEEDVDELNSRVKGANRRARHLVGK